VPTHPTVLLLISSEGYFGVENMLVNLAVALSKHGCRCVVAVFCDARFNHTEVGDQARARGLSVEIVNCSGRYDWRAVAAMRTLMNKYRVDVLHTHGYKADLYGCAAAWGRGVGLVATCHNWPHPSRKMQAYAVLDRLFLRTFDRVVVLSETVSGTLRRSGLPQRKLQTIANGVEVERFREARPSLKNGSCTANESIVGFVGRLVPGKGVDILLRAAPRIFSRHPNSRFVLVGDGPCRQQLQSLAAHLGIADRVLFAGMREDMPQVYASIDLLVLPSLCEAMPMCILEAMAAGKPVIATRVGAVPQLIDQDQTGVLIEPGDVMGLSVAVLKLLENPERARQLGENGRARTIEQFSADSMARRYLQLYSEVANTCEGSKKRNDVEYEYNA
jgi:glycosyltransferase involved in cell wall biosynthesis